MEKYTEILPEHLKKALFQFRMGTHKLPVNNRKHFNVPRADRHCTHCDKSVIGDEIHFLYECTTKLNNLKNCEKPIKLETSPKVTKSKRSLHWCRSISVKKYLCRFYYIIGQEIYYSIGRFITLSGSYYIIGRFLLHYQAVITVSGIYYIIGWYTWSIHKFDFSIRQQPSSVN